MEFFQTEFLGNSWQTWLRSLAVTLLVLWVLIILKTRIGKKLVKVTQKMEMATGRWVDGLLRNTKFYFLLGLSIYAGSQMLDLPSSYTKRLDFFIFLLFLLQVAFWGGWIITFFTEQAIEARKGTDEPMQAGLEMAKFFGKFALWVVLLLVILDNLGVNITALMAGLGVGGIAVALAVQNILGDLFASLTIVLDKPFVKGDFIIVGDCMGAIEKIGLKTTRIRSLTGEQLIMSNADLLQSRIRNYKRMQERRVAFNIGVVYQTPLEKVKSIPGILKEIIESQESVRFDRAHFKEYGQFALNFEVIYWVLSPDYNLFMNIQQTINLLIYERFENEKIEFAYPTQTV
ncbi:MAG: mechanosensitive ion channel family protein, partial [Desulfobacterales bacterium]